MIRKLIVFKINIIYCSCNVFDNVLLLEIIKSVGFVKFITFLFVIQLELIAIKYIFIYYYNW